MKPSGRTCLSGHLPHAGSAGDPGLSEQKGADRSGAHRHLPPDGHLRLLRHPRGADGGDRRHQNPLRPEVQGGQPGGDALWQPGADLSARRVRAESPYLGCAVCQAPENGRRGGASEGGQRTDGLSTERPGTDPVSAEGRGVGRCRDACSCSKPMAPDSVRKLSVAVMETCGGRCGVFSGDDEKGYKYAVGQAEGDLRAWVKTLNQALQGRGGGKGQFRQGSVQAKRAEIQAFGTVRKDNRTTPSRKRGNASWKAKDRPS